MSERLQIVGTPTNLPQVMVLRLSGPLDGQGGQVLMQACAPYKQAGVTLVLSCAAVSFVSSSGIGVMLALSEDFRDRGLRLRIASPSPDVRMAIDLLNLEDFLSIDESESQSLERLAA